ncbi:MAG TPA: hypothetical protein DCO79_14820 [Spirochaeta sp.]|nr:hypothetical protein [Spirochaeta sp.]
MALDPTSKIPKYLQIRQWMLGMIGRGKIKIGDKIPTEEELAKKFSVNRMTVRQALDELVLEKMIVRKRGEGTILVSTKPQGYVYGLENISSFNDDMELHGIVPIHEMLRMEVVEPDARIAHLLELGPKQKAILTVSVKKVENEPVLIEKSYISHDEFEKILDMQLTDSFYHLLVEEFGVELHHSTQIFHAVLPAQPEMDIFEITEPEPCMMLESTIYDSDEIPIEVLYSYYRGSRYRFKANSGEYFFSKKNK